MGIFSKSGIIKIDSKEPSLKKEGRSVISSQKDEKPTIEKANSAFFVHQSLQSSYVYLKTRLSEFGTKFDPEMYVAGITIALAYVKNESGIFTDFAEFMQSSFGDGIKPHLLAFYTGICNLPETFGLNLTSYEDCLKEHAVIMQKA